MPGLPCRDHGFDELPLLIGEIARVRLAHAHATTQANPERLTGSNAPPSHHRAMTSPTERHIPHSERTFASLMWRHSPVHCRANSLSCEAFVEFTQLSGSSRVPSSS